MLALLAVVLMIRPRTLLTPVGAVALILLLFSVNCRVQIGIRFMFTLMAVGYIALAIAVANSWQWTVGSGQSELSTQHSALSSRFIPRWFVAALLTVMAGTSAWMWPDGLRYTNQLWGGVEHGYRHLSDSNYDWGHGLPELKSWNRAHNEEQTLAIWYFGTDPAILYAPYRPVMLHKLETGSADELRRMCGTRYLAVATSQLYGFETDNPGHLAVVRMLREAKPIGRTPQFLVYDLATL
jgi:hypothetical protein